MENEHSLKPFFVSVKQEFWYSSDWSRKCLNHLLHQWAQSHAALQIVWSSICVCVCFYVSLSCKHFGSSSIQAELKSCDLTTPSPTSAHAHTCMHFSDTPTDGSKDCKEQATPLSPRDHPNLCSAKSWMFYIMFGWCRAFDLSLCKLHIKLGF